MSNKRGKQKNYTDTDDFEAFFRESLVKLSEGQDRILHDVAALKGKVQLNEPSAERHLSKTHKNQPELRRSQG